MLLATGYRRPRRAGRGPLLSALVLGVGSAAALAQTAELRLVALATPSATDSATVLPASSLRFRDDGTFVVELWAQTTSASGLSSVSTDVDFTHLLISVGGITHSATFSVLTSGAVNNTTGVIDNLSGSHLGPCTDAVGVAPVWARVATLQVTALAGGTMSMQLKATGSPIYGTAACGVGNLVDSQVTFGSASVDLVACLVDADCDDGQYCNGPEACDLATYTCQPGVGPVCNDGVACTVDACDFAAGGGTGACVYMPNHTLCDNLLFCDGTETCDALSGCMSGSAPCTAECEHCVESTDSCALCILDLDSSGVMGTGDFSLFAPCFGACYAAEHSCRGSDFDGEDAGCVGTADFAAFAGCFGYSCGQCPGCSGPGGGGGMVAAGGATSALRVRAIPRRSPSAADRNPLPPLPETEYAVGDRILVEVWASMGEAAANGLASAYVDLQFDPLALKVVGVDPSGLLPLFAAESATSEGDTVAALGGCAALDDRGVGASGDWIRVGTAVMKAARPGIAEVRISSSDVLHGFAVVGSFGNIEQSQIEFEGMKVDIRKGGRTIRQAQ